MPLQAKELPRPRSLTASCHNHLGMMWLEHGPVDQAAAAFDQAIAYRRDLLLRFPAVWETQVYLGGALCNRGHAAAATFYNESLKVLRQPNQTCTCSYWDEERQSWWRSQLEALAPMTGLQWVDLPPIHRQCHGGLASLKPASPPN